MEYEVNIKAGDDAYTGLPGKSRSWLRFLVRWIKKGQRKTSRKEWRSEDTGAARWSFYWPWRETLSAWATCGGSLTSATKMEEVKQNLMLYTYELGVGLLYNYALQFVNPGAFLVPYVVFVVTCGVPLFLLETTIGQYTQEGGITCWRKLCPLAEGTGRCSGRVGCCIGGRQKYTFVQTTKHKIRWKQLRTRTDTGEAVGVMIEWSLNPLWERLSLQLRLFNVSYWKKRWATYTTHCGIKWSQHKLRRNSKLSKKVYLKGAHHWFCTSKCVCRWKKNGI